MKIMFSIYCFVTIISCQATNGQSVGLFSSDTIVIHETKYIVQLDRDNTFYIFCNKDTIVEKNYFLSDMEIVDFNLDGFMDIKTFFLSNVPGVGNLFLFDHRASCFKKVTDFENVPNSKAISEANLYYSYRRSGCGDMNWESDLFTIKDFNVLKIGNIQGVGCEVGPNGIFVYKLNDKRKLVGMMDMAIVGEYKNDKWEFIKQYWSKNYRKFASKKKYKLKRD